MLTFKNIIKYYKLNTHLLIRGIVFYAAFIMLCSCVVFASHITDLVNVTKYHAASYKGKGVKCAIVDNGFDSWKSLNYVNHAHARFFPGNSQLPDNPRGDAHGTGMAEIFHKIAPEAEIYLIYSMIGIDDDITNYFKAEGIVLASESLNVPNYEIGYSWEFLTGDDTLSRALDTCVSSNITVCVIAGNYAEYSSSFHLKKDSSSNRMMFPGEKRKLNIESLVDGNFFIVFSRSGPTVSSVTYYQYTLKNVTKNTEIAKDKKFNKYKRVNVIGVNQNDNLTLKITKVTGNTDEIDIIVGGIFSNGSLKFKPEEVNKALSLALPGASKKSITTGAIAEANYHVKDEILGMSGWGPIPSYINRMGEIVPETIKPDLCAPGGATSPTAPMVAGALAVLASAGKIDLSKPDDVKKALQDKHTIRMGGTPNNTFGYGRLYLDADTDWPPQTPGPEPKPIVPVDPEDRDILIYPNPASISRVNSLKIANFSQNVSKLNAEIYDINGETIKSFNILELQNGLKGKSLIWNLRNEKGEKIAPGLYFITIKIDSGITQIRKIAIQK